MEDLMKFLTIATVVAIIALLPGYSHAMASRHHHEERGAGHPVGFNAGSDTPGYTGGSNGPAPVSVPEPGGFLLLTSGLTTLGGLLAGRWYVTKKREKRPERHEP
jgi:hypothetical protein